MESRFRSFREFARSRAILDATRTVQAIRAIDATPDVPTLDYIPCDVQAIAFPNATPSNDDVLLSMAYGFRID